VKEKKREKNISYNQYRRKKYIMGARKGKNERKE